ncbi:MAG: DUF222 domain-containing protein, partial [Ilumatobacter sp.]|nr:DUF222 domain-containing protein [Ilumatobacter sp.]
MDTALAHCSTAIAAVAAVPLEGLSASELGGAAVSIQGFIDRLTMVHARVVAEADRAGVWGGTGARNMADWLSQRTKTSYGDAMDRVKLGDAAEAAPELEEAVSSGEMSAKSAVALHGAITSAPEGADVAGLVEAAKGATPREAADAGEKFKESNRSRKETPEEAEERRHQKRSVRSGRPEDGMVTTTVVLPTLQHRQFINAITHVAGDPYEGDTRTTEQRLADGVVLLSDAYAKGAVTGGRERPTLLLVLDVEEGEARTAHGDNIPGHIAERLAENALVQRVLRTGSRILDLGNTVRLATDAQYKALVARDGGCRWPGCHIPAAWCEIDHLVPF